LGYSAPVAVLGKELYSLETETPLRDRIFVDAVYAGLEKREREAIERGRSVLIQKESQVRAAAIEKNLHMVTSKGTNNKVDRSPQSFISKYFNPQTLLCIAMVGAYIIFACRGMGKKTKSSVDY
jgi:hypothetical protein